MAAAPDLDRRLAARVYAASHLTGTFTLRSGVTSSEYFDKYRFEADPALLNDIAIALAPLVPADAEALAGPRTRWRPARNDAVAAHRTPGSLRAQGGEDATAPVRSPRAATSPACGSASSKTWSHPAARSSMPRSSSGRAARCSDTVVCVIDRESSGVENLGAADLELRALFTMSQLRPG